MYGVCAASGNASDRSKAAVIFIVVFLSKLRSRENQA
jgi:hypothetical protein